MKIVFFALIALLVAQKCQSQEIVSRIFLGGKYGTQKMDSSKAVFVETIVRSADGSLTKTSTSLRSGIVLSTESRRDDEPVGRWIYRDERGAVRKALDYDFEFKKGQGTCLGYLGIGCCKSSWMEKSTVFSSHPDF